MNGLEKQKLLLSHMVAEPSAFSMCKDIMAPDRFDMELRRVVKFMLDHSEKYKIAPNVAMIAAETGISLPEISDDEASNKNRVRWACDEMEVHCRTMATVNAVIAASDLIAAGKLDGVVGPIKDAVMIGLHRDMGLDYFADPAGRLRRMQLHNSPVPTGFKHLDQLLFGGVAKGGVNIFVARSGGGKSVMLQNLACNHLLRGDNVVYISLELYDDKIAKRIDSMLTGIPSVAVFDRIDEVHRVLLHKSKKAGHLRIKYMPSGSSTAAIGSYLKGLEIELGVVPDAVMVDYLDLVSPSADVDMNNVNLKDKYVAEELRNLNGELGTAFYTASQLTKGADADESIHQGNVAGGKTKVDAADTVIAMFQNMALREAGQMQLSMLKSRDSDGDGKKMILKYDGSTMRLSDASDEEAFPRKSRAKQQRSDDRVPQSDSGPRNIDMIRDLKARSGRS